MAFDFTLQNGETHTFPHAPECVGFTGVMRRYRKAEVDKSLPENEQMAATYNIELEMIETLLSEEHLAAYDLLDIKTMGEWQSCFMGGLDPKASAS